jgi:hypothetical protein
MIGPRFVNARGHHALADLHVHDAFADRVDHAGDFSAAHCGQLRLVAVLTANRPEIVIVNRRQRRFDSHLARAGIRRGTFCELQHFGRIAERGIDNATQNRSP